MENLRKVLDTQTQSEDLKLRIGRLSTHFSSVATTSTCDDHRNWSIGVTEVIR